MTSYLRVYLIGAHFIDLHNPCIEAVAYQVATFTSDQKPELSGQQSTSI